MIRHDAERGVHVVDIAEPLFAELEAEWSPPVQHRIADDALIMRALIRVEVAGTPVYLTAGTDVGVLFAELAAAGLVDLSMLPHVINVDVPDAAGNGSPRS